MSWQQTPFILCFISNATSCADNDGDRWIGFHFAGRADYACGRACVELWQWTDGSPTNYRNPSFSSVESAPLPGDVETRITSTGRWEPSAKDDLFLGSICAQGTSGSAFFQRRDITAFTKFVNFFGAPRHDGKLPWQWTSAGGGGNKPWNSKIMTSRPSKRLKPYGARLGRSF